MTNLEQSFVDLCAKYDLLNADITMHVGEVCRPFTASVQWDGALGRGCTIGHGNTIAEALGDAIAQMVAKRNPPPIELCDEALPELAA